MNFVEKRLTGNSILCVQFVEVFAGKVGKRSNNALSAELGGISDA